MHRKTLSYMFTHLLWRDIPLVEDSHAGYGRNLSIGLYYLLHDEVNKAFVNWNGCISRYDKRIDSLFIKHCIRSCDEWKPPRKVRLNFNGDVADAILGGNVLKACRKGLPFNDDTMMALNIDVNNRVYTLLDMGIIEM